MMLYLLQQASRGVCFISLTPVRIHHATGTSRYVAGGAGRGWGEGIDSRYHRSSRDDMSPLSLDLGASKRRGRKREGWTLQAMTGAETAAASSGDEPDAIDLDIETQVLCRTTACGGVVLSLVAVFVVCV